MGVEVEVDVEFHAPVLILFLWALLVWHVMMFFIRFLCFRPSLLNRAIRRHVYFYLDLSGLIVKNLLYVCVCVAMLICWFLCRRTVWRRRVVWPSRPRSLAVTRWCSCLPKTELFLSSDTRYEYGALCFSVPILITVFI